MPKRKRKKKNFKFPRKSFSNNTQTEENESPVHQFFYDLLDDFSIDLEKIHFSVFFLKDISLVFKKKNSSELDEYLSKHDIQKTISGERITFHVPLNLLEELNKKLRFKRILVGMDDFLPEVFYISLFTNFEGFLIKYLNYFFKEKKEILNISNKTISVKEVLNLANYEGIENYIIESEIDKLNRTSIANRLEYFEKNTNFSIDSLIQNKLIHAFEIRNCLVHHNGRISSQYLNIMKEKRFDHNYKKNEEIIISSDFFNETYNILIFTGILLVCNLWEKIEKENKSFQVIFRFAFNFLEKGFAELALLINNYLIKSKHSRSDEDYLMCYVNLALSHRYSGNEDECIKMIKDFDWSSRAEKFKMAEAVILNKIDDVIFYMNKFGDSSTQIKKEDYKTWPLFKEMKKNKIFQENYKKIFQEEIFKDKVDLIDEKI